MILFPLHLRTLKISHCLPSIQMFFTLGMEWKHVILFLPLDNRRDRFVWHFVVVVSFRSFFNCFVWVLFGFSSFVTFKCVYKWNRDGCNHFIFNPFNNFRMCLFNAERSHKWIVFQYVQLLCFNVVDFLFSISAFDSFNELNISIFCLLCTQTLQLVLSLSHTATIDINSCSSDEYLCCYLN